MRRRTSISIVVTTADGMVRTVIEDDGAGFAFGAVRERRSASSACASERCCSADGSTSSRRPGAGTTIVAEIPLG